MDNKLRATFQASFQHFARPALKKEIRQPDACCVIFSWWKRLSN
jgi:hypothetical protein